MLTMRPSCSAARRWIEWISRARRKLCRDCRCTARLWSLLRSAMDRLLGTPVPARSAADTAFFEDGPYGTLHQAVRQPAGLRLPLLRSHCHPWVPERPVPTRAGGLLLPRCGGRQGRRQGGAEWAHRRVPELGRGLCPQSPHAHRVGREGCALQAPLPDPQDLRAQLRVGAVATVGRQDLGG